MTDLGFNLGDCLTASLESRKSDNTIDNLDFGMSWTYTSSPAVTLNFTCDEKYCFFDQTGYVA